MARALTYSSQQAAANKLGTSEVKPACAYVDLDLLYSNIGGNQTLTQIYLTLHDIRGPLPNAPRAELLTYPLGCDLAEYAGFYLNSSGVNSFDANRINLAKLTYYIAFRTPFQVMKNGKNSAKYFDTLDSANNGKWYEKANNIRVVNWAHSHFTPVVKRLAKNGEEEIYPVEANSPAIPTATTPEIYSHRNTTLTKYNYFGEKINSKLAETYFTAPTPPLEHLMVTNQETPYFEQFIQNRTSVPFFIIGLFPNATTPLTFPITFNESTVKFFTRGTSGYYYRNTRQRFAKVVGITDLNSTTIQLRIFGYKITKRNFYLQNQSITLGDGDKFGLVDTTGELYFKLKAHTSDKTNLLKDINIHTKNYIPEYELGEVLYDNDIGNDINGFYIQILAPQYYTADVPLSQITALGLNKSDLYGCRVYEIEDQTVLEYVTSNSTTTTEVIGGSGFSTACGLDLGTGVYGANTRSYRSPSTPQNNQALTFDEFMRSVCSNWSRTDIFGPMIDPNNPVVSSQRKIIFDIFGKRDIQARDYWIKHRGLFELLDFDYPPTANKFKTALATAGILKEDQYYIENFEQVKGYYGLAAAPIMNQLVKAGLKTEPNIVEKYTMLAPTWNIGHLPKGAIPSLVEAINKHDLSLLKKASENHLTGTYDDAIPTKVKNFLNRTGVQEYYEDVHFN